MPCRSYFRCPACAAHYRAARPEQPGNVKCHRCGVIFDKQRHLVQIEFLERPSVAPVSPVPPNVLRKGANYISAWLRWSAAGFPVRQPAEIARLREICRGCGLFDADKDSCLHPKCGCKVGRPGILGDKLAWKTETCPAGLWK